MVFTVFAESKNSVFITDDSPYKYDVIDNGRDLGCLGGCTGDGTVPLMGTYGGSTTSSSNAIAKMLAASMVLAAALLII